MRGQVEVKVTTAVPLTDEQRDNLKERPSRYSGRDSFLVEVVDADLLGGLVIQVGDSRIDGSLRTRLQSIGSRLEGTRFQSEDYYED